MKKKSTKLSSVKTSTKEPALSGPALLDHLQNEFNQACARLGHAVYQLDCWQADAVTFKKEVHEINEKAKTLRAELEKEKIDKLEPAASH